jgi:hypothetical protein
MMLIFTVSLSYGNVELLWLIDVIYFPNSYVSLIHRDDALNNYPALDEPIANEINQHLPPPLILPGIPYPGPAPIAGVLDHGHNIIDRADEEDDNIPPIEEDNGNMDPDGIEANIPEESEPEAEEPELEEAEPEGNMRGGHNLQKHKAPSYAYVHAMDAILDKVIMTQTHLEKRTACIWRARYRGCKQRAEATG